MSKQPYIPPTLTVVTFRTERGYALSEGSGNPITAHLELMFANNESDYQETEVFSTHNTWNNSSSNSFWE